MITMKMTLRAPRGLWGLIGDGLNIHLFLVQRRVRLDVNDPIAFSASGENAALRPCVLSAIACSTRLQEPMLRARQDRTGHSGNRVPAFCAWDANSRADVSPSTARTSAKKDSTWRHRSPRSRSSGPHHTPPVGRCVLRDRVRDRRFIDDFQQSAICRDSEVVSHVRNPSSNSACTHWGI